MGKTLLVILALMIGFFALLSESEWMKSKRVASQNLLPSLNYKADVSKGEGVYQQSCIRCHGEGLTGTGQGPSLLDSTYESLHHSDLSFFYAVKSGVRQHHWKFGDMPMITGVPPERVSDIIAYVRSVQKPPYNK